MKLPFRPVNMKNQKVTKSDECHLELLDNKLIYTHNFMGAHWRNPEDELLGMEEPERIFSVVHVLKTRITAIEIGITTHNQWHITISVDSRSSDISIYFDIEDEKQANAMFSELNSWVDKK